VTRLLSSIDANIGIAFDECARLFQNGRASSAASQ